MTTQRTTPTHVYFWGGKFSNFYRHQSAAPLFETELWRNGPKVPFYHSEGYFMACKAMRFGQTNGRMETKIVDGDDVDYYVPSILEQVLDAFDPKTAKACGRAISNFDEKIWRRECRNYMFRAVWAKFSQNVDLARSLVETGDRILVEGSPHDAVWGVGLAWNDPAIDDEKNWKGTNWLGDTLMLVRALLANMDEYEIKQFDPFKVSIA